MRLSEAFAKTRRETPREVENISTALLARGGFIDRLMAGVYTYLPFGWRVHRKIESIIREEMATIGGQELFMPALHPKEPWDKSGRWEKLKGVMYQFKDNSGKDLGLGFTHEETISAIASQFIQSYKDLPQAVFQIQTKFRDEPRAKSGLLRGKEFIMKDLYSFHADMESLDEYYQTVTDAYVRIFKRCGLEARITEAGGDVFSEEFSHEFQVLADVGEDRVIYCPSCPFSQNIEIAQVEAGKPCPQCGERLVLDRAIEVGNIFKLGTKFSEAFGVRFADTDGKKKPVLMASYGIGLGRIMGTVAETHFDEHGLIWPESIAPYDVHIIDLGTEEGERVYSELTDAGFEVLFDDRSLSAGEKFADADLIGVPYRIIISSKTISGQATEVQTRKEKVGQLVGLTELVSYMESRLK